jgi:hypothetical protein
LNVTVLVPCVAPKFVPAIVTVVPTAPEVGDNPEITAGTVNVIPLLANPPTVTTTLPVVAPIGTFAAIDVLLHVTIVAAVPLNVTVLLPCVAPKFVPAIATVVPAAPEVGERLLIPGRTENGEPLLATPLTVTTTLPDVAPVGTFAAIAVLLHVTIVAAVPLNVTVLVPCVVPKFVPAIVTVVPAAPEVGERPEIIAGTVNVMPLLATPLAVTTTLPLVAPVGTTALIDVLLQLEIEVAAVPLNATVLLPCVVPKFVPAIVTAVPTAPEVGDRPEIDGVALSVTVDVALTLVFAALVAVIVTVCCVVTLDGAVYRPELLIVPAPVAGLIDHVTAVFVLPTTVAVNCCVPPAVTVAVAGETVTDNGIVYVADATALFVIPVS